MKIIITYLACTFFFLTTALAQLTHSLSLGPELGIPLKSFGQAKPGIGGGLEYQLKFHGPVGVQVSVGYLSFPAQQQLFADYKISFLPIRAGIVGFLYEDIVYVFADAGISQCHVKKVTNQSGLSVGAGVGYKYMTTKGQFIQLAGFYNIHNFRDKRYDLDYNYSWLTIRLAYGFRIGKRRSTG